MQGVLTFVVVRPLLAAVQMICMAASTKDYDRWGEDEFTLSKGWMWVMLTNNAAQVRAAACSAARLCL